MCITISSPHLYTSNANYSGHLVRTDMRDYSPLTVVSFGETAKTVVENPPDLIPLPAGWATVTAVVVNGMTFTKAQNPSSPQPGEYLHDPYNKTVRVYT